VLLVFFGVARVTTKLIPGLASLASPVAVWAVSLMTLLIWPFFTLPYWLLRRGAWGRGGAAKRIGAFVLGALINPIVLVVVLIMIVRRAASSWRPEWPAEFPGILHVLLAVLWPFWVLPYWLLRRGAWGPGAAAKRIGAFVLGALINPIVLLVVLVMVVRRAVTRWHPRWPTTYPGVVPGTVTANVGRENSRRNAQRTASTASALMIGLALVTLVATLAAGIVQTFRGAVDDLWKASDSDYAITAQNNFSPIPVDAANSAAQAPGVVAVMNVRTGEVRAFDETTFATAVDPTARELINMKWKDGSQDVLANLGETGAFVDDGYADDNDLEVGSTVEVTFPDGTTATYTVDGIFDPPTGGSPFGSITISTEAWDAKVENPRNLYTFIAVEGDVSDENTATLEEALADYPNAKVQTREQFIDNQIAGLNAVLNILYVLLALSVLVSLFGIVNTLVLTVFERTREIGMLRAIGMTRLQVRRMIRHESVITALVGAMIGIVLGVVLAVILIARVEFIDFAFPTTQIIVFVIAAVLVGIVAAIFPARRAAKLDPLEAIAYE
jgi:ABC-type lipoprotein release transport system permease subunit